MLAIFLFGGDGFSIAVLLNPVPEACIEKLVRRGGEAAAIGQEFVPAKHVGYDKTSVAYSPRKPGDPNRFSQIAVKDVPGLLDSVLYYPVDRNTEASRMIPEGARAFIDLHHGASAAYSQSACWFYAFSLFTGTSSKPLMKRLKNGGGFFPVGLSAIDSPLHGVGIRDLATLSDLRFVVDWYVGHFLQQYVMLKKMNSDIPFVPIMRSTSAAYYLAAVKRYPWLKDIIDGVILLGPVHPVVGMAEEMRLLDVELAAGEYERNVPAHEWVYDQMMPDLVSGRYPEHDFTKNSADEDPFGLPTYVMIGEEDYTDMPVVRREEFERMVAKSNSLGTQAFYRVYPGQGHDVFSFRSDIHGGVNGAEPAWQDLYTFLDTVVIPAYNQKKRGQRTLPEITMDYPDFIPVELRTPHQTQRADRREYVTVP